MFKKLIKRIRYFFIGLKFRYLVKLIAMNYCDRIYYQIQGKISALDKDTLTQPDFLKNLLDEYKIAPIIINNIPTITNRFSKYTSLPDHVFNTNLSSNGEIDIYTFEYDIEEGDRELNAIKSELKVFNTDFNTIIQFSVVKNKISFEYENWLPRSESEIKKLAQNVFVELDVQIQDIVGAINYSSNFIDRANDYIKHRLIFLNKNN
jgi:hypothetical protein